MVSTLDKKKFTNEHGKYNEFDKYKSKVISVPDVYDSELFIPISKFVNASSLFEFFKSYQLLFKE